MKNEQNCREMWDNMSTNIYVMGLLEGRERKESRKKILEEMMAENLGKHAGSSELQIGKTQRDPQIVLAKLLIADDKEKILKTAK